MDEAARGRQEPGEAKGELDGVDRASRDQSVADAPAAMAPRTPEAPAAVTPAPSHAGSEDRVDETAPSEQVPQEAAGAPHAPEAADPDLGHASPEAAALDGTQDSHHIPARAAPADDVTLAAELASLELDKGSQDAGARSSDASFVATGEAGEPLTGASPSEVPIPEAAPADMQVEPAPSYHYSFEDPSPDHQQDNRPPPDLEDDGSVLNQAAQNPLVTQPIAAQVPDALALPVPPSETSNEPASIEAEPQPAHSEVTAPAEEQAAALGQRAEDSSWSEGTPPGPDAGSAVPDASAPERALTPVVEEEPALDRPNIDVGEVYASDPPVTDPAQEPPPAHHAPEPPQPYLSPDPPAHASSHPAPRITSATPAFEPVHDQPAARLHEDEIWSGPEADDGDLRRPRPGSSQRLSIGAFSIQTASAANTAASRAIEQRAPGLAAFPSVPLPARETLDQGRSYLRLAVYIAGAAAAGLAATVLLLILLYRWMDPPTSTLMLGQRLLGTEIEQRWVPIERVSPHLVQAVILSEDGAFCRHRGVDWTAMSEAIESARGGSTITMQVVKNLFLWPARSYVRKALEIVLAYIVEVAWGKQRILEIYLNIAEWGPGVFGAEAAARNHFAKRASQLTPQEAALLAVSLPSPLERQASHPGWQTRRLANNLLIRMRAARSPMRCVRGG